MNRKLMRDLGVLTESAVGRLFPVVEVTLLTRPTCPKADSMRAHLESALTEVGWSSSYAVIDQTTLEGDDRRNGYPIPTVLYRGRDLFGLPVAVPPYQKPT
jgi:hypothetical protein